MNSNSGLAEASSESRSSRSLAVVACMLLITACVSLITYDAVLLVSKHGSLSDGGIIVSWLANFHPPIDHSYSPWRERIDSVALALAIITPIGWLVLFAGMVYLIWNGKFSLKTKVACYGALVTMCIVLLDALTVILD